MAVDKVLVVDDSVSALAHIRGIVKDAGYTVITATSGAEAVDKAINDNPDVIFLDIVMPEMDGYAACREIQKNKTAKNIPVVFVSSKNKKADRLRALMQGGKGYLTKPYSADEVVDQLSAFW